MGVTSCFVRKLLLIIYLYTSFYFLVAEGTTLRSETRLKVCICTREWYLFFLMLLLFLVTQMNGFCQNMPNSCLFQWRLIQLLFKNYSSYGNFIPCFPNTNEDGMRVLSSLSRVEKQFPAVNTAQTTEQKNLYVEWIFSISSVTGPRLEETSLRG